MTGTSRPAVDPEPEGRDYRADLVAGGLLVGATALGLVLWPTLPARLSVEFAGESTRTVTRTVAVALAPVVGTLAVVVARGVGSWVGTRTPGRAGDAAVVFLAGSVASLQVFVYAWNLGAAVPPALAALPPLFGATVLVGYGTAGA